MISQSEIEEIKNVVQTLLQKMTVEDFNVEPKTSSENSNIRDTVELNITLKEPQILIGQNGQTLFEIQRILRIILNKKLKKDFYLDLDINGYKKKKIEYLKELAKQSANEVSLTNKEKILAPMPAHERRIIHLELAQRKDIVSQSQGDEEERHIIIKPANYN